MFNSPEMGDELDQCISVSSLGASLETLDFTHLALVYKPFPHIVPADGTLPPSGPSWNFFIVQCDDSDSLDSGGSRPFTE